MNIREYRKTLAEQFAAHGFESSVLEADYIVSEITAIPHLELLFHGERPLSETERRKGDEFTARRLKNEPFQYIFGWTPFRGLDLEIGPGALIPRPETEALVDPVLRFLPPGGTLCELGTGSGAISLAAASERPDITVFASELSPDALAVAKKNLAKTGLANVRFFEGDLFSPFDGRRFDAVVANLPYIPYGERDALPPNVRDYEPPEALFADDGGFSVIERAIGAAPRYLNKTRSALFFELGEEQGERAAACALSTGFFRKCRIGDDPFGVPRFLSAFAGGEKDGGYGSGH